MTTLTEHLEGVQQRALAVQVRAAEDGDGRTFTGLGVPYGQTIEFMGWREAFDPGSITGGDQALILWRHDEPIGRVTGTRETENGFEITGRLSDTPRGTEAATLLRDGVIDRMSIGFEPIEYRVIEDEDGGETIHYTSVRAREFSLVPFPAYDAARVTSVRHRPTDTPARKDTPMPETLTRETLDTELQARDDKLSDLQRELTRIADNTTPAGPAAGTQFRSMGHLLKQLAAGDEAAMQFHREFAGGTLEESLLKPTPVGEFIKWINERTPTLNLFTRGTLPPTGNSVEFVRMPAEAMRAAKVDKQATEGADLAGPFKINLSPETAKIETWGGWTELSRQLIERSQHNYLDKTMRAMGMEWARYAESRFKAYLAEKLAQRAAAALSVGSAPDYTDWLGTIVDAGDYYSSNGYALEGLLLSPELFKSLALLEAADGRPLMSVYGTGVNTTGEVKLPSGSGNLAGVPVRVLWDTEGVATFYDSSAIQIDMSPGAPAQLQDENIINLTKQFSIYGYAAMYDPFPGGLLPVSTGADPVDGE